MLVIVQESMLAKELIKKFLKRIKSLLVWPRL